MAGAFDWLDTLASGISNVAGKAVDAAATVATAKATAGASQPDLTPASATSPLQVAVPGGSLIPWAIGGVALLVGVYFLARRK